MVQVHSLVVGGLQTNCYILQSHKESVVVDAGDEPERILRFMRDIRAPLKLIVATHAHFDHVLGVEGIRKVTHVSFAMHKEDLTILESMQERVHRFTGLTVPPPPKVDKFLEEGDTISLGQETVRVLHTPGHSPGSISLAGNGYVLTGDALFNQSIGRTDLPGGDFKTLVSSIREKLFRLEDNTVVHPGHGPETRIGDEKLANPFVGRLARLNE